MANSLRNIQMNQLLTITKENASALTMGSLEIAELLESRHDSVKRTIVRLQVKGLIQLTPLVEVKNHLGQIVTEYQLVKRDTYVVVAQLSPEFTARLVDRWQELENQQKPTALIPQSFSEALMLAAQLQAEKERNAPKVAFVDHYVEVGTRLPLIAATNFPGVGAISGSIKTRSPSLKRGSIDFPSIRK